MSLLFEIEVFMLTHVDEKHVPLTTRFRDYLQPRTVPHDAFPKRAKSWKSVVLHNVPVVLPYPKII